MLFFEIMTASSLSAAETHPIILYTANEINTTTERLSRDPYATWLTRIIQEADEIIQPGISWSDNAIPQSTKGYYAKLLACAHVFADSSLTNHQAYGDEAAKALYYIPGSSFSDSFSSNLEVSESAMYWAEAYDMLKGAEFDFAVAGFPDMENHIRDQLTKLRRYMALYDFTDFDRPSIANDFPSAAFYPKGILICQLIIFEQTITM